MGFGSDHRSPVFWNLVVSRRTRISLVIAVIGLEVLAYAASVLKTAYLYKLEDDRFWLWNLREISIWRVVELGIRLAVQPFLKVTEVLGGISRERGHRDVYLRGS